MTADLMVRIDPAQLKTLVEDSVRQQLVQALSKDPDAIVRAVVDAALKSGGTGYGRTPFSTELDKQIREIALEITREILAAERPKIEAELRRRITAELLTEAALKQTIDQMGSLYITVGTPETPDDR